MGGLKEKVLSILCWNQPLKTLGIFLTVNVSLTLIVIFGLSVLSLTCYIFILLIIVCAIWSSLLPPLEQENFQFMPREWLQYPFEHTYEFVNDTICGFRRLATWQNKLLSAFSLIVFWGLAYLGFLLSDCFYIVSILIFVIPKFTVKYQDKIMDTYKNTKDKSKSWYENIQAKIPKSKKALESQKTS